MIFPSQKKRPRETGFVFLAAATFYAVFLWRNHFFIDGKLTFSLFDDAMISLRYARNWALGEGLRWNAGEPAVEGYSNFLWTAGMAALHWLCPSQNLVSLFILVACAVILLANAWYLRKVVSDFPTLATAAVLFYYPLVFWTLRGMEVGLITLLMTYGYWQSRQVKESGQLLKLSFTLALLTLVRDDAAVACAVLAAGTAVSVPPRKRVRTLCVLGLSFLIPFAGHLAARKVYYGEWLPNTYHLKMVGLPLKIRLASGAYAFYALFSAHLWPLLLPALFSLRRWRQLYLPWAIVIAQTAYSIYAGGDAWEWMGFSNRYLTVASPFLLLLALAGAEDFLIQSRARKVQRAIIFGGFGLALALFVLRSAWGWPGPFTLYLALGLGAFGMAVMVCYRVKPNWPPVTGAWLFAILFFVSQAVPYTQWLTKGANHGEDDRKMATLGNELAKCASPTARVAVTWAGAIPYFSRLSAVDLLGKSDATIAHRPARNRHVGHNKWDLDYSIKTLTPDIVVFRTWMTPDPGYELLMESWGYRLVGRQIFLKVSSATEQCLSIPWDRL